MKGILLTRPYSDALKSRNILLNFGFNVYIESVLQIEYLVPHLQDIELFDLIISTSKHSIISLSKNTTIRSNTIITVGNSTMNVATSLGFDQVLSVNGNTQDVISYIQSQSRNLKILYIRGEHITCDIKAILNTMGFNVHEVVMYKTIANKLLSKECYNLIVNRDISEILFYSSRSAEIFIQLVQESNIAHHLKNMNAYVLSNKIANVAKVINWRAIFVTDIPTESSLIQLLIMQRK
ncbi:uroporphyrinogen-III synthase [Neoehrlichia mikurensis]|uniref:Uroporphyrinogen-III synthase n=1 Tax=Neoehrlichia mikurensis TaxID=89586 RepID=A0A9Q9F3V6_9RICK|nr:uroporphyrinogen-III synthase [Neoehrlichia mikurensis]QXK91850.1 uroporphyrinogen-III synthase [Neoehrlichia mikurensis]QXK93063.1 uroporphyrinogen-III synthase [Neoehrlichia mikurensis]QXK93542.1 uroporphyrinogen-III synthase [Neoehrlichia mikurensis]UTO55502.1 uroporphyrinogen-III synthase [Neoehrlichia mikurensis]UTO56424.1 uroporphyrinogen-III synthase [Neoehrlichia mikurensis]